MPGSLTAVYRLVSFSGRLPFAVFPPRFFHSMALPLSGCYLPNIFHRSNDRASASWVSSSRKGRRRSAPAARPLLICHLCSQSLPVNGTSPGDGRSGAAGISSALCAIGRDVVHVGAVPAYLPLHCAHIPANQPGNLMAAQAIHVIFPYTTALFYAKMMAVHTLSLLAVWLCAYSILPPGGLYELLFVSLMCCS